MGDNTAIEWTDSTWNPVTGCDKVSDGCTNCYAEALAHRFSGTSSYPNGFAVTLRPERLEQPLHWTRPRRIFVNSMSDLFHTDIPTDYIARVWAVMARAQRHTFQVLTKRHARMRYLLSTDEFRKRLYHHLVELDYDWIRTNRLPWPLPNVWIGVSAENQRWFDIRWEALRETPAAIRFLSLEPLLGPIDMNGALYPDEFERHGIGWVIVGGESGPHARPLHPDWARSVRNQCVKAGVPFLFKQHGEYASSQTDGPGGVWAPDVWVNRATGATASEEEALASGGHWQGVWRVGKKRAGRELDGRTWDEYPDLHQLVGDGS